MGAGLTRSEQLSELEQKTMIIIDFKPKGAPKESPEPPSDKPKDKASGPQGLWSSRGRGGMREAKAMLVWAGHMARITRRRTSIVVTPGAYVVYNFRSDKVFRWTEVSYTYCTERNLGTRGLPRLG